MRLTEEEQKMLDGAKGEACRKSAEILRALGEIYGAEKLIPVKSVQIAGVSFLNLGDAGLEYLEDLARDGRVAPGVTATLNPAGMDLENWRALGIPKDFAEKQARVIAAFKKMGVAASCTCTPYLAGNLPMFEESIAWSESSAVCYANSVIGAKTNREGGPSALAAALTGRTPFYGMHLEENRQAQVLVEISAPLDSITDYGALGYAVGKKIGEKIPLFTGIKTKPSLEELKTLSASIATYGGTALFHIEGITPNKTVTPKEKIGISEEEINSAKKALSDSGSGEPDFVSVGCPHASLEELKELARLLEGKQVRKEFWVCVSRFVKKQAEALGIAQKIEASGAKFACDTCMVVAPLKGRFRCLATNSAKSCYYARGNHGFKTRFEELEKCVEEATR